MLIALSSSVPTLQRRRCPTHSLALTLALLALSPAAEAHEPLFGVGPHTMFKGGLVVPVWARLLGTQADPDLSGVVAVEAHL